ncbi:hypothetical protein H351_06905 [Rhodococcus erythropolis R138]|uniref:hypothetical protein n=1 Tax=Rhodococcus erythropolis TaxID=1833 RepID=UPI0004923D61|nr:hypothetical protein [Rhodococcus erythropolis]ALU73202.1 hypothetical protein H351_06905 [Rhodococcus erythropolis R138]
MRESLNHHTLFNTITLVRPEIESLILVTEGEDDHFVIKNHSNEKLYIIQGNGKGKSLGAATLAEEESISGVTFLVDSDYDQFLFPGKIYPSNVLVSNTHDIFMDIALKSTRLLDSLIQTKVRSTVRRTGNPIATHAVMNQSLSLAAAVAPLRIVNERYELDLKLSDFPFGEIPPISPSIERIASIALARSNTSTPESELSRMIREEKSTIGVGVEYLVGDHDFFRALARVLVKVYDVKTVTAASLFDSFITALNRDCAAIMETDWYSNIANLSKLHGHAAFSCPC